MMGQYYTIVTNKGTEKIAKMIATGQKITLDKMKFGDSNGVYYEPSVKQTALKNVKYECQVNTIKVENLDINNTIKNVIKVEGIIPASEGGFYIREVGVFDSDGDLIAVGKYSESYKPTPSEGTAKELIVRLVLDVDTIENVNLSVNANLSIVTKEELAEVETKVDDIKKVFDVDFENMKNDIKGINDKVDNIKIADATTSAKGVVQLNNDVNSTSELLASTPKATKVAYDKAVEALNKANEAFQSASNGKNYIAGKVGNVTGGNTHNQIGDRIQTDKNNLANIIRLKGGDATGTETLDALVSIVNGLTNGMDVNVGTAQSNSTDGLKFYTSSGGLLDKGYWGNSVTITGFNFNVKYAIAYTADTYNGDFLYFDFVNNYSRGFIRGNRAYLLSTTTGDYIRTKGQLRLPCASVQKYTYLIIGD